MEATQVPMNRQLDIEEMIHIYNGILHVHKKDETLPFVTT